MTATHVDISDVLRGLEAMRARGMDLRPVFRAVRVQLKADVAQHFARKEGPDGAWAPRAASTIERAKQNRGMTFKRGGRRGQLTKRGQRRLGPQLGRFRFPNAYRFIVTRQAIEMRAKGDWAGVHQFGGVVGHGAVQPERTFLWASDSLVDAFEHALVGHVREAW